MLAVIAVGVDVLGRVGALGGQRGRVRDAGPPGQRLLGSRARSGTAPMLASAIRPPEAATPTIAQSLARRMNFW